MMLANAELRGASQLAGAASRSNAGLGAGGNYGGWQMQFDCECGATSYEDPPECPDCGKRMKHAAARLEVLEREHQKFFERWHGERRKREALADAVDRCYRMLISEPDTKGALFKAENILREALADSRLTHNV